MTETDYVGEAKRLVVLATFLFIFFLWSPPQFIKECVEWWRRDEPTNKWGEEYDWIDMRWIERREDP